MKNQPLKDSNKPTQIKPPPQSFGKIDLGAKTTLNWGKPAQKEKMVTIKKVTTAISAPPVKEMKPTQLVKPKVAKPVRVPLNEQVKQELFPCKDCGRNFNEVALKRHEKICKKVFLQKRKEFNSAKQRVIAKEEPIQVKKGGKKMAPPPKQSAKVEVNKAPLWREQSQALRIAMKQARGALTAEEINIAQKQQQIAKKSEFQCKTCGRHFNQQAGIRHAKFCQEKSKQTAMLRKKTK